MTALLVQELSGREILLPLGLFTALAVLLSGPLARALRGVPAAPPRTAAWGPREAALVLLGGLALALGAGAVAGALRPSGFLTLLYLNQVVVLATALLAAAVVARHEREPAAALGLAGAGLGPLLPRVTLAYALAWPALGAVQLAWAVAADRLGIHLEPQDVMTGILGLGHGALVQALVVACLVGPFLEEVLFRGFLQPALVRLFSRPAAGILATSLLFGALHGLAAFPQIFCLSLLLGWIRHRSGSTLGAWVAHGLHNGLQVFLALQVPFLAEGPR